MLKPRVLDPSLEVKVHRLALGHVQQRAQTLIAIKKFAGNATRRRCRFPVHHRSRFLYSEKNLLSRVRRGDFTRWRASAVTHATYISHLTTFSSVHLIAGVAICVERITSFFGF